MSGRSGGGGGCRRRRRRRGFPPFKHLICVFVCVCAR